MPWSARPWQPGILSLKVPRSLALQMLKSHRSQNSSITYSHVSTCWLFQLWLHPPRFSAWIEAPEQDSSERFSPTHLSRRRHSQRPTQSTNRPEGTCRKGWGRPSTSWLKHFPQLVGAAFLPTPASPHCFLSEISQYEHAITYSKYLSFCISLVPPIYWLNVLKTRVYNPSIFVSMHI